MTKYPKCNQYDTKSETIDMHKTTNLCNEKQKYSEATQMKECLTTNCW